MLTQSSTGGGEAYCSVATYNPLRYRGYVYDTLTTLYYLQSRYYDPLVGRFISADALVSTGQGLLGNNMFAYCRNNPVSRKDASGTEDVCVTNFNEDDNPLNDLGNPSGQSSGNSFGGNASAGATMSPSISVDSFLTSQGQNPKDVLQCFSGEPKLQVVTEDTTVFRVWGEQLQNMVIGFLLITMARLRVANYHYPPGTQ